VGCWQRDPLKEIGFDGYPGPNGTLIPWDEAIQRQHVRIEIVKQRQIDARAKGKL
jgi:hypothetical protein